MYLLFNNNYPEDCRFEERTLEDIREHLKYLFKTSFTIVSDNDKRVIENSFLYCSQSRFDSIERMTFEELKTEFEKEYSWTLQSMNENKEELVLQ